MDIKKAHSPILLKRCAAFATDLFLVAVLNNLILLGMQSFLRSFFYQLSPASQISLQQNILNVASASFLVVFTCYFMLSYFLGEGKTPGKHFFGLHVLSSKFITDGEYNLKFKEAMGRVLGHLICLVFIFPLLLPLFDNKRRGLADILSKTSIIPQDEMMAFEKEYRDLLVKKKKQVEGQEWEEKTLEQLEIPLDFSPNPLKPAKDPLKKAA